MFAFEMIILKIRQGGIFSLQTLLKAATDSRYMELFMYALSFVLYTSRSNISPMILYHSLLLTVKFRSCLFPRKSSTYGESHQTTKK